MGCPETSVTSYQPMPRNTRQEQWPQLGRSQETRLSFVANLVHCPPNKFKVVIVLRIHLYQLRDSPRFEGA